PRTRFPSSHLQFDTSRTRNDLHARNKLRNRKERETTGKTSRLGLDPTGGERLGRRNPGSHDPPSRGNYRYLESTQHFIFVHDREARRFISRQFRLRLVLCRNGSTLTLVVVLAPFI